MAGLLSRTPHQFSLSLLRPSLSLTHHRHRSNKSGKPLHPHLIELDLDSSSDTTTTHIRKLDDVIHNIIVRRSAPDWLPFLPGSSYWVPPCPRHGPAGLFDVIGKLAGPPPRSDEETLSFSSVRGWPSSHYYIQGSAPTRPIPVDAQVVEVKFQEDSDNESQSEDEKH